MAFKVAVASSDGKFINQHFGRARQFLVFSVSETGDGSFEFIEQRESAPPCTDRQHDENQLEAAAELLADCRIVLVSQIGPGAVQALAARGVTALEGPAFIEEALVKLSKSINRLVRINAY